jgi:hypothetical protein
VLNGNFGGTRHVIWHYFVHGKGWPSGVFVRWKTKALTMRVLSKIPLGGWIHFQLQRHLTHQIPRPIQQFPAYFSAADRIIAASSLRGSGIESASFIEIGSGRDLASALALRMRGVGRVICTDVARLAKLPLIQHAAKHLSSILNKPEPQLSSWSALFDYGIDYQAPAAISELNGCQGRIDCCYSVDTLEHIPPPVLLQTLIQMRNLLKAAGRCVHMIDYSDHYARDSAVSRFNFLKFTEEEWAPYNCAFHYVNRLRHSEYIAIFRQAGFEILNADVELSPADDDVLSSLAPQFARFSNDDLFARRAQLVAAPIAEMH